MALKKYKPITAGTRWKIGNAFAEITTDKPEKSLLEPIKRTGGRNAQGRRAMRYIGGGHKKQYRVIDFKRNKHDIEATVVSIEYDPNRTCRIALIEYKSDKTKSYILAPVDLRVGHVIVSTNTADVDMLAGNCLPLRKIPLAVEYTILN